MGLLFSSAGAHTYLKSGQVAPSPPSEIALQQRAKVVIEGIISDSDWLKSKLIAFLANQNGRKYQNKPKESDFWES